MTKTLLLHWQIVSGSHIDALEKNARLFVPSGQVCDKASLFVLFSKFQTRLLTMLFLVGLGSSAKFPKQKSSLLNLFDGS
jgi:hypothetical protein